VIVLDAQTGRAAETDIDVLLVFAHSRADSGHANNRLLRLSDEDDALSPLDGAGYTALIESRKVYISYHETSCRSRLARRRRLVYAKVETAYFT